MNPSADIPLPDFESEISGDRSMVDEELVRGETEGFRDWNRRIVPVMMGRKLSQSFVKLY
jgi:hypothetical protein